MRAAAPVADRMAAVVDRIGHRQVVGDPLVQLALRGLRELRQAQPGGGAQVGHVCAGPTGDGVDDDAGRRSGASA